MKKKGSSKHLHVEGGNPRLNETHQNASASDLLSQSPLKKSKTPGRSRGANAVQSKERTTVMAQKIRQSVFKLAKDEEDTHCNKNAARQPRSAKRRAPKNAMVLQDATNQNQQHLNDLNSSFPESPQMKTTHAIPTVSAKLFQQQPSPEKFYESQQYQLQQSPTKSDGRPLRTQQNAQVAWQQQARCKAKDGMSVEELAVEFFRSAMGDLTCEELEKVQLQQAIAAMSERLLLLQNVDEEKKVLQDKLAASEQARLDLQKVLTETSVKTKHELSKLEQYQEIMLQENRAVSEQLTVHRLALQTKEQECDQAQITIAMQNKEVGSLKLQTAELMNYRNRYEEQSSVTLVTKETQIEKLHQEIEDMASKHSEMIKEVNGEKELLIAQNCELKKQVAQSSFEQDMLKTEVERHHTKLQSLQAELEAERKHVERIKATSADALKVEEELRFCKQHNSEVTMRVNEVNDSMVEQQRVIEEKLAKLLEDKLAVEDENKALLQDIKSKDEIIKQLTRENLAVNSNLTQVQQLLCSQEDQEARVTSMTATLSEQTELKADLNTQYDQCSTRLLEVEERLQETQAIALQLLRRCQMRDEQIERLQEEMENMQSTVEGKLFIYKPLQDDPIDRNLANYINKAPLRLRSKMHFEREAPGIYRFARKKVFMKIEGETIVIRVGGGYLTIQEFVAQNCGIREEDEFAKKRITNLVYAGQCAGNKDFKTFYLSQQTVDDMAENRADGMETPNLEEQTADRFGRSPLSKTPNSHFLNYATNPSSPNQYAQFDFINALQQNMTPGVKNSPAKQIRRI